MEHSLISQVYVLHIQAPLYPFRQLLILTRPCKPTISQNHHPIVVFASHYSPQTLRTLPHGIELEKLITIYDLLLLNHKPYPL